MDKALLIVDDEENIIRALKRLLRSDGYTVYTANSGQDGLACLQKNDIQVILSDMRMPEMNGAEFLANVKELYPDTVRMMLSGYTDLTSVTDAINQGSIYKFLTKPWDDALLKETVRDAFKHYADKNQLRLNEKTTVAEANESATLQQTGSIAGVYSAAEIFDLLPIGVVVADANGRVYYANQSAEAMITHHENGAQTAARPLFESVLKQIQHSENGFFRLDNGDRFNVAVSHTGAEKIADGATVIVTFSKIYNQVES